MTLLVCRLCKLELRAHERAEGYCDGCLKAYQVRPGLQADPPTEPEGDLERIEPRLPATRGDR